MACDIANGRVESCKDSVSGIDAIYFVNYQIEDADLTYDGTDTDMITLIAGLDNLYKFELKGNENTFEQEIVSSRDNGTTFFTQTLSVKLKKQDAATTKNVKLLSYGRPHIIVKTKSNQFFIMGLEQGADVTGGTISTGGAMGDFNGYSLTFTAEEKVPANFLDAVTETALLAVVTPAPIVTA